MKVFKARLSILLLLIKCCSSTDSRNPRLFYTCCKINKILGAKLAEYYRSTLPKDKMVNVSSPDSYLVFNNVCFPEIERAKFLFNLLILDSYTLKKLLQS